MRRGTLALVVAWGGLQVATAATAVEGDLPTQRADTVARELIQRMGQQGSIDSGLLERLRAARDGADALARYAVDGPASERKHAVVALSAFDARIGTRDGRRYAVPRIRNATVNAQLVASLSDPSPKVRNATAPAVARLVPDEVLRIHSDEIVASANRYEIDDINTILGRTGSAAARELLTSNAKFRSCNPRTADLALARLGDTAIEQRLLEDFAAEQDPARKAKLAEALGYIGSPKCARALAGEMRTDMVYTDPGRHQRSLRVDLIEALSQVYEDEELLYRPLVRPETDGYYETIEKWCEKVLSVTWDGPRPPFSYITDVPILPHPGDSVRKNEGE